MLKSPRLNQQFGLQARCQNLPISRVMGSREVIQHHYSPFGGSWVAGDDRDRKDCKPQGLANRKPVVRSLCLFETDPGLIDGLIQVALQRKNPYELEAGQAVAD